MFWRSSAGKRRAPGFIEPCIPTQADKPPVGPEWIHEIKHDGYRLIVRKKDDRVRLFTRRGYDWTDRFPLIRDAVAALRQRALVLDGEAVVCDDDGTANFAKLHSQDHNDRAFLFAFDLLELGGVDVRPLPLEERRGQTPISPAKGHRSGRPVQRSDRRRRRDNIRACLQAGVRGHRLEAPGASLPIRAVKVVDQGKEPVGPRDADV